jgi:hypothetical protein
MPVLLQGQLDAFDQQIFVFMSASAGYVRDFAFLQARAERITSVQRQTSLLFGRLPRSRPCSLSTPCGSSGRIFTAHRSTAFASSARADMRFPLAFLLISPSARLLALGPHKIPFIFALAFILGGAGLF